MDVQNSKSEQTKNRDVARYRANYLSEREGAYLYSQLAAIERDAHLAELYQRLAAIEQRHADLWKEYLTRAGATSPTYAPTWRIRALLWLARRLGTGAVLSTVSSMEQQAVSGYDTQPEAVQAGLPADERSHARLFSYLLSSTRGGDRRTLARPIRGPSPQRRGQ